MKQVHRRQWRPGDEEDDADKIIYALDFIISERRYEKLPCHPVTIRDLLERLTDEYWGYSYERPAARAKARSIIVNGLNTERSGLKLAQI